MALLEDAQQAARGLDPWPLLPCAILFAAVPLCLLARGTRAAALSIGAAWASFAAAVWLLVHVLDAGPRSAPAVGGGWAWPWSGEHHVDAAAGLTLALATGIGALASSAAPRRLEAELGAQRAPRFRALCLLFLAALARTVVSGHLLIAVAFMELALLAVHALVRFDRERLVPGIERAHRRLWVLGATALAFGVLGVYAATGALDMAEVRVRAADVDPLLIQASFWLLAAGTCLTLGLTALELWRAGSAGTVHAAVLTLQASAAGKVALFLVLRFSLGAFGEKFTLQKQPFELLPMALALALLAGGTLLALFQTQLPRLLCWTSVAQIGALLLGASLGNVDGLTGALTGSLSLALAECTLFLAVAAIGGRTGSLEISALAGIGRSMPWTLGACAVAALGLAGVPPTVGFVSTWYLVLGALQSGLWPLALLFLAIDLAALAALGRVLEVACRAPLPAGRAPAAEAPLSLLLPMWIAALAALGLGLATGGSADIAARAAGALLEVAL